jgi:glutamate 5-kinase
MTDANLCSSRASARRIVIKLGSNVLGAGSDRLNRAHLVEIVRQIAQLHHKGIEVAVVTSGAVLAGRERMGYPQRQGLARQSLARQSSIPLRQMLAAIGQGRLMHLYEQFFDLYDILVAQILLTADDFRNRQRYLNARDALLGLLRERVVPIINENDTVATDEIKVGDNDNLAALVVTLIEADLLILLSDIKGLYTADPRLDPNAQLIEQVTQIDDAIWSVAGEGGTAHGTGGMRTKIQAALQVQRAGASTIIADGCEPSVLLRIVDGERIGTHFLPQVVSADTGEEASLSIGLEGRKRWILAGSHALGKVYVDQGAAIAITQQGKSLLPVGVVGLAEHFERGETVRIFRQDAEIARGVIRYSSDELAQIKGLHSFQIREQLGYDYGDEVVHHNDMVMLESGERKV